ncbi:MAG: hypothetical protein M3P48_01470, partial [Actinomycetota bacterium]|nr:hypothetical protein [Actinomycetota bacterium]
MWDDDPPTRDGAAVPASPTLRAPAVAPPVPAPLAVELRGFPVRLGLRLREHREAVRRECQLLLLASEAQSRELPQRLLQMSEALSAQYGAELSEPERRKVEAFLRGDELVDLTYPALPETLSMTLAWRGLLSEIDRYCRTEGLLTLATPLDLAELTEWILDEFVRQVTGHPPRPWWGPLD